MRRRARTTRTSAATASYTRLEPNQSFTFPGLGTFSLAPEDNWDFHLGLNQVITQFGKREVQVKMAESGVTAARIGVDQARTGVAYQAAQVFYTVLFLQEQGKALDTQIDNLQQHLQVILVREQTGSATRLEELSTQVRMAALQSQRTDVENQLQKQKIALRQLVGLEPSEDIAVSGSFEPGRQAPDAQALVASALQKRPEVRQAMEAENAADLNQRLTFDSLYPTLSARGTVGYRSGLLPNTGNLSLNASAGVLLTVPVFQGFLWARSMDEARTRLDAARAGSMSARLSVTTQVLQAAQDVQSARRQVTISSASAGAGAPDGGGGEGAVRHRHHHQPRVPRFADGAGDGERFPPCRDVQGSAERVRAAPVGGGVHCRGSLGGRGKLLHPGLIRATPLAPLWFSAILAVAMQKGSISTMVRGSGPRAQVSPVGPPPIPRS